MIPPRPKPIRNVFFVDGQNLYHRCREHFGWPWIDPLRLAEAFVYEDRAKYGPDSQVLAEVRFYTGIHDPNRRRREHAVLERRLVAYRERGIHVEAIPLRYDAGGRGIEKGVDVRIALDLMRLAVNGSFDVATVVTEDSDLDEAVKDVLALRDDQRWLSPTRSPGAPDRTRAGSGLLLAAARSPRSSSIESGTTMPTDRWLVAKQPLGPRRYGGRPTTARWPGSTCPVPACAWLAEPAFGREVSGDLREAKSQRAIDQRFEFFATGPTTRS